MNATRRIAALLAVAAVVAMAPRATEATEIGIRVSSTQCSLEEVITVQVSVENPTQATMPKHDETADWDIRLTPGMANPSQSTQTTIINGVVDTRSKYIYTFEARPKVAGQLMLPAFVLSDGGKEYRTSPIQISVSKRAGAGKGDVFAKVVVPRSTAYVGEPFDIQLQVFVRQYEQQGIQPFDDRLSLQLAQFELSQFGIFEKAVTVTPSVSKVKLRDDRGILADYYGFSWEATVYPANVGPFDFGNIVLAWRYPQWITRGFMTLEMPRARNLRVAPELPSLEIKPIPKEGRPADYNGAVGNFIFRVTAAPRDVQVGDPITLTMTIRGDAAMERLGPPRLAQVPALTSDFELSGESLAGDVATGQKSFSQTIRALRESVTQIPRLPFSFFNPTTGTYATSWSEPIPLKVRPAERVALPGGGAAPSAPLAPLVETAGGLRANHSDLDLLMANQAGGFNAASLAFVAALPLVFLVTWFVHRRSEHFRRNTGLRRRRFAGASARKALDLAVLRHAGSGIAAALLSYIADRFDAPAAGMTRADALARLQSAGVSPNLVTETSSLLESLEYAEYGGMKGLSHDEAATRARRIVDTLEKLDLT